MAKNGSDTFVFYPTFLTQIEAIKDDMVQLAMFKAIVNYGLYDSLPDFTEIDQTGMLDALFVSVKFVIDQTKARRKTNQENGRFGGAPNGNKNAEKQPKTTENNQEQPTDKKNNLNENVYVHGNGKSKGCEKSKQCFSPPTLEDIQSFCKDEAINIDTDLFYNHFASVGWKVGNKQMKDWKAAVKVWARRDETRSTATQQQGNARRTTEIDSGSWKDYEGDF